MNRRLLFITSILLAAWISLGLYLSNKYICGAATASLAAAPSETDSPARMLSTLDISDGGNFSANCSGGFDFLNSAANFLELPANLQSCLSETANYLKENPTRMLSIMGLYAESENNTGVLADLGMARANNVKKYLVDMGVAASQFEIGSELLSPKFTDLDTLLGAVSFKFGELKTDRAIRLAKIKEALQGKPLTLYFASNSNKIDLSDQQRQEFADLIFYLDNVQGSNLNIDGHSDNLGERSHNVNLSKQRAEFVKEYLNKNGINSDQMAVNAFGPDQPLDSNNTADGRAKNRRVEITLQ